MKKIDTTLVSGDSGPVGGGKINYNFNEVAKILFGVEIWDGVVIEDLVQQLQNLPTNNKTSFLAALNEVNGRASLIDDSSQSSVVKTWSIDKLKQELQTHVNIQGAFVEVSGKTDLTQFEVGDKFGYWVNDNRYVVGEVVGLPVTLTNDIDDVLKITLIYDSAVFVIDDGLSSSIEKTYSIDKIISYVANALNLQRDEILGGAGDAVDTLLELNDLISENDADITGILTALANRVRIDVNNQNLTATQKQNALTNLGISLTHVNIQGALP